jgi:hypothetical protein
MTDEIVVVHFSPQPETFLSMKLHKIAHKKCSGKAKSTYLLPVTIAYVRKVDECKPLAGGVRAPRRAGGRR